MSSQDIHRSSRLAMTLAAALVAATGFAAPVAGPRWFEDRTAAAGLDHPHHNRKFDNAYATIMAGYTALGAAAAVGDYNGDGFEDLFVTDSAQDGRNHLYRNNGDLTFTDVAEEARVAAGNDADNASAKIADGLFEEIAKIGEASVRRIYGDFSNPRSKAWAASSMCSRTSIASGRTAASSNSPCG